MNQLEFGIGKRLTKTSAVIIVKSTFFYVRRKFS